MKCPNCGSKVKDGASFCPNCGSKITQESGETPYHIFRFGCRFYKPYDNSSDLLIAPITESDRAAVRTNFNIDRDEEILVIRDTSFWNTRNQGLVLTDKYIRVIVDNDNITEDSTICWSWDIIAKVEYQELNLYFYDYQGNNSPIGIMYFLKDYSDESVARKVGCQLASLFNQMAKAVEPQASDFDRANEEIEQLCKANKYQEAAVRMKQCAMEQPENASIWYEWLGRVYQYVLKNNDEAIKAFNNALETANLENTEWIAELKYHIYSISFDNILSSDASFVPFLNKLRPLVLYVAQYGNDDKVVGTDKNGNDITIKKDASGDFSFLDTEYRTNFLDRPYNERKILLPVKQYTELDQEVINVLSIDNLPEIEFPMGHPIANQLYIGHPYLPHKYIPFENYQLELVEDKVREFCAFVQKLGATEITIECLNSNSTDATERGNMNASGNTQHKVVDANGSYKKEYSRHLIEELTHSINMHQEFAPNQAPALQENMVWYNNEPSWQRLYEQRMSGSLLYHEERIETRKSQMVEGNEMSEIKAEVKALFSSAGIEWNKSMESQYQMQENAILSIKVRFAPMSSLTGQLKSSTQDANMVLPANSLTKEEQEYLDELKECLSDGEIGNSERRLLNKLRVKLGISEERAAELEASLQKPELTEEEQEYLEAYQDAMEDGVVSEKKRRLLDKLMKINNISEERAKEIEMSKNHG